MATPDVNQAEIVAQLQAFMNFNKDARVAGVSRRGLPHGAELEVSGRVDASSQAVFWRYGAQEGLQRYIQPHDPDYQEKLIGAVKSDVATSPFLIERTKEYIENVDTLSTADQNELRAIAALNGFDTKVLLEDGEDPVEATKQAAQQLKDMFQSYSVDGQEPDAALTSGQSLVATQAYELLQSKNLVSEELQETVGDKIDTVSDFKAIQDTIKASQGELKQAAATDIAEPAKLDGSALTQWQAVLGLSVPNKYAANLNADPMASVEHQAYTSPGLMALSDFSDTEITPGTIIPRRETFDRPLNKGVTDDQYTDYFINNVVLHSQRIEFLDRTLINEWEQISDAELREKYDEVKNDDDLTAAEKREQLAEISQDVRYKANYNQDTKNVWEMMKKNDALEAGIAIELYLRKKGSQYQIDNKQPMPDSEVRQLRETIIPQIAHLEMLEHELEGIRPSPELIADTYLENYVLPDVREESKEAHRLMTEEGLSEAKAIKQALGDNYNNENLKNIVKLESRAIAGIREEIIKYEGLTPTTEAEADAYREDATNILKESLSQDPELAAKVDNKVDYYLSKQGGALDIQSAMGRVALDLRNEMDAQGGPTHMLTNQESPEYRFEATRMSEWIQDRVALERFGGVDPSMAEGYGWGDRDVSKFSTLDFYTSMYGGGYRMNRSKNLEKSMQNAYEQVQNDPSLRKTAAADNTDPEAEDTALAEAESTDPEAEDIAPERTVTSDFGREDTNREATKNFALAAKGDSLETLARNGQTQDHEDTTVKPDPVGPGTTA